MLPVQATLPVTAHLTTASTPSHPLAYPGFLPRFRPGKSAAVCRTQHTIHLWRRRAKPLHSENPACQPEANDALLRPNERQFCQVAGLFSNSEGKWSGR